MNAWMNAFEGEMDMDDPCFNKMATVLEEMIWISYLDPKFKSPSLEPHFTWNNKMTK